MLTMAYAVNSCPCLPPHAGGTQAVTSTQTPIAMLLSKGIMSPARTRTLELIPACQRISVQSLIVQYVAPFSYVPLLMLWVLRTDDVHVLPTLPPDALTSITQLLHTAPHFHAPDLLSRDHATSLRAIDSQILESGQERWLCMSESRHSRARQAAALARCLFVGLCACERWTCEDDPWAKCSGEEGAPEVMAGWCGGEHLAGWLWLCRCCMSARISLSSNQIHNGVRDVKKHGCLRKLLLYRSRRLEVQREGPGMVRRDFALVGLLCSRHYILHAPYREYHAISFNYSSIRANFNDRHPLVVWAFPQATI